MSNATRIQSRLKSSHLRLTEARKSLIEVLFHRHLTFKEIYQELSAMGHHNVATLYNNIAAFIDENIIIELNIDGTKYYDLAVENTEHDGNNHLHIVKIGEDKQPVITETNDPTIFEMIKDHSALKDLDIDSIKILVTAKNQK
mgnify:CR=1 FL=1